MNKNVLIISSAETFLVKGLQMKLSTIGLNSTYCNTRIKQLTQMVEDSDYFIFYTDDTIKELTDVLVFINDICTEKEKKLIVIGSRLEYDVIIQHVKADNILNWFERPLDMNVFVEKMQDYIDDAAVEARKKSILIVDDDVTYMRMIAGWLKDSYRVYMVNSGVQAITWLAKNKADLILLDYEMPITPGPKVLEMLKTEANTSTIPVMFLTGKGDRNSIVKVLSLKPADYLLKTIDKKTLHEKLDTFFLNKRVQSN